MKNIFKVSALFCLAALTLASCQKELETAQFSDDQVTLASFAPNPAMRGGTLTFIGSNLDRISEVLVPGMDPITGSGIEVLATGKVSKIRVVLDREKPEVGYVTLKSNDGKELKTKSELTYKEPIVFDGFDAPATVFPEDVITLKGTYMDLIKTVTFEGGTKVAVLEGATRHEAKVKVPYDAKSGIIVLSDGADIESLFYSEKSIKMGEPKVTKNAKATLKAGDEITVKGEHLEMIDKIVFDGAEIEIDLFKESEVKILSSLTFFLPATAKSGEYSLVSYEGKSYVAGEFEAAVPVITSVVPGVVKAGNQLTINGSNLDLIVKVSCTGMDEASFTATETQIKVDITNTAIEGDMVLETENGTQVKTAFALEHAAITKVAPLELYAGDEPVIVTGTNLDLVKSATLGGKDIEIKAQSETEITLATTVSSVGGKVVLTQFNGETVESTEEVSMKYHALVIVSERPDGQHIGEEVVLKGENMSLIENIFIGDVKVTKYSLRTDNEVRFLMPWNKVGSYELKFVLFNGDEEVQPAPIEVLLEFQTWYKYEGNFEMGDWGGFQELAYGAFDFSKLPVGATITVEFEQSGPKDWHQIAFRHGESWGELPEKVFHEMGAGETVFVHTFTASDLADLVANNGLIITGTSFIIKSIVIRSEISQEVTVFKGPCQMTWGDDGRFGLALEYFKDLNPGAKMIFYLTHTTDWGQIQINDGWWGNSDIVFPEVSGAYIKTDNIPAGATRVELTLTEDLLKIIKERTGGYQGVNTDHASPSGTYCFVIQGEKIQIDEITVLQ